jgi:hypothetical protein
LVKSLVAVNPASRLGRGTCPVGVEQVSARSFSELLSKSWGMDARDAGKSASDASTVGVIENAPLHPGKRLEGKSSLARFGARALRDKKLLSLHAATHSVEHDGC